MKRVNAINKVRRNPNNISNLKPKIQWKKTFEEFMPKI
jgi:hypothetical protein